MSVAILAPGSRTRRFSKRLTQVVVTLFGLLLLTFFIGRVMPVSYTHLTLPTTTPQCRSRWSPYH